MNFVPPSLVGGFHPLINLGSLPLGGIWAQDLMVEPIGTAGRDFDRCDVAEKRLFRFRQEASVNIDAISSVLSNLANILFFFLRSLMREHSHQCHGLILM